MGTTENVFDFGESDFEIIVKTSTFVDKTLLIKDIFQGTSKIQITAPRQFGKSTNMDMVKRFLEIEVDTEGKPKNVKTTRNYKLFKDNNLEICKHEQFFNENFGKHPVIYIDYKPLSRVNNFDSMLEDFRRIVVETFSLHTYLMNVDHFWIDDLFISDFKRCAIERQTKYIGESDLKYVFKFLSKVLYRYFGKKAFVLIDNYDAFFDNIMYEKNHDTDRIISFIQSANDNLLKSNRYIGRAFLTGVLRVTSTGLPDHGNNIISYCFLTGHPFSKYYGLTTEEFDKVLNKLISDEQERKQIKSIVDEYYNGYTVRNQNFQLYNIWSVLQYLSNREVQSYWCMPEYFRSFEPLFKVPEISGTVNQLILGNPIEIDLSQPLGQSDISQVNHIIKNGKVQSDAIVEIFIVLLFHLGYLSISKDLGRGKVTVKIPNEEIKYEMKNILAKTVSNVEV